MPPHFRIPGLVSAVAVLFAFACAGEPPTDPAGPGAPGLAPAAADRFVPGRLLVQFRPGADAAGIANAHGAALGPRVALGIMLANVEPGQELAVAERLRRNPNVEFAEPDWLRTLEDPLCPTCTLPNDGLFGYKWDLYNDGTINSSTGSELATTGAVDADIDWAEAFDSLGSGFAGTARVAILDTGVRWAHEDLTGRVVAQNDFINNDSDANDDQGHGTHVAGIAAAAGDNGKGLTGVAYGPGIGIMAGKICRPTFGGLNAECPSSAIVAAITWAVDNGANVINLSLGGAEGSLSEQQALQYARANNVLAVCAAGNDGQGTVLFPAAFPECAAVSATDWFDGLASYSNWGPEVLLAAPGGDTENSSGYSQIASTCFGSNTQYCLKAGTSMATPQVAGLATLLYATGLTTDEEVLERLQTTADDLGDPGWDQRFGHGRINAFRAIGGTGGPTNAPPTASFTFSCTGADCTFTDTSTDSDGTVVAWSWNFGDGGTSTAQNPTHTYACSGSYTVSLTVTDNLGRTGSTSQVVTVTVIAGGAGDPSSIPDLAMWLQADALTGLADGAQVATWSDRSGSCNHATQGTASKRPTYRVNQVNGLPALFFDGTDDGMSTPVNPGVPVTIVGVYASRAAASGYLLNGGCCFLMGPYSGLYRNYTGAFANGPGVQSGKWVVQTLRQQSGRAELWLDGTLRASTTSTTDPSSILLAKQGTYSQILDGYLAELLVYRRTLSDAELGSVHNWLLAKYTPAPPPNQPPSASFTSSCTGLTCSFTDTSTDSDGTVVAWSWTFGDGATSTTQSPSHTYAAAGSYTVALVATDDDVATGATSQSVTVTAPTENQPPSASFSSSCTGLTCSFTDTSTDSDGTVVAWSWTFGDGATSTTQSPSHTYAAAGSYTVTLAATDDDGETGNSSASVTVTNPSAFDPSSVPNLGLWLRADAITGLSDGSPVATWPGSGGSPSATQSSASRRPIYRTGQVNGLPALFFDATDDGMATSVNPGVPVTIFLVYASRAGASGYAMNAGSRFLMGPYSSQYRNYTGAFANGGAVTGGRWVVQTLRQSTGLAELFLDGVFKASATKTANPTAILLADQGTYGLPLDGTIAEVIVYQRTLTNTERQDVENWLRAKYALP